MKRRVKGSHKGEATRNSEKSVCCPALSMDWRRENEPPSTRPFSSVSISASPREKLPSAEWKRPSLPALGRKGAVMAGPDRGTEGRLAGREAI